MNKYEMLFNEILDKTISGAIQWCQINKSSHSGIIFNPSLVFRQYEASYSRHGADYTLLVVEKKYDDPEHDYQLEKYFPELLILSDDELVTSLTDSVIDRSDFFKLIDAIEIRNEKAKKLFG